MAFELNGHKRLETEFRRRGWSIAYRPTQSERDALAVETHLSPATVGTYLCDLRIREQNSRLNPSANGIDWMTVADKVALALHRRRIPLRIGMSEELKREIGREIGATSASVNTAMVKLRQREKNRKAEEEQKKPGPSVTQMTAMSLEVAAHKLPVAVTLISHLPATLTWTKNQRDRWMAAFVACVDWEVEVVDV